MKTLLIINLFLAAIFFPKNTANAENYIYKMFSPEALIEDLSYLFKTLEEVHPDLYYYIPKSEIDSMKSKVIKKINRPMTRLEFARKAIPLTVALGDGHTYLSFPREERTEYLDQGGGVFPFNVITRDNRIFIASNFSHDKSIEAFSEIISINSIPAEKIISEISKYVSAELDHFRIVRIERSLGFYLWLVFGFEDEYALELKHNGKMQKFNVSGITIEELRAQREQVGNEKPYSFYMLEDNTIGVIDFRQMIDAQKFSIFLDSVFTIIDDKDIQHLVIDTRQNGGGNSYLANLLFNYITENPYKMTTQMDLKYSKKAKKRYKQYFRSQIKWYKRPLYYITSPFNDELRKLFFTKNGTIVTYKPTDKNKPEDKNLKFTGETYLLTSHYTFSSANMLAAAFKHYNMGLILGEETGGVLNSFGEMIILNLPNTNLSAYCSIKRFVHPGYDGKVSGVVPDIEIKPSLEDIIDERDVAIEYVINLVSKD